MKLSIYFLLFGAPLLIANGQTNNLNIEINSLFNNYFNTLKTGNIHEVHKFWSENITTSIGNTHFPKSIGEDLHISEWEIFLDNYKFTISEIKEVDDYLVIEGKWSNKNISDSTELENRFYLMQDKSGIYKLYKPVDLVTRDWQIYESKYFNYHFSDNVNIESNRNEISMMDLKCEQLSKKLNFKLDRRINFYKAKTSKECGELLNSPPALAYANRLVSENENWFDCIVSTKFYDPHELTHGLTALAGIPDINTFFLEGLAVAEGGITILSEKYISFKTKELMDAGEYVPISHILNLPTTDFIEQSNITYYEAGAFVKYLLIEYSFDKYLKFLYRCSATNNISRSFYEVYHASLENLESDFIAFINTNYFTPTYEIPPNAILIEEFSSKKKKGFVDVKDEFSAINCNIHNFKVYKTTTDVFFEIEFDDLKTFIQDKKTGEKFSTSSLIAIKRGDFINSDLLRRSCCNLDFSNNDGYDILILAGFGVVAYNNFNKIDYMTGFQYDKINKPGQNTITFSLPISYIGQPDKNWKYFVGTGIQRDYGADIVYSGIMDIKIRENDVHHNNFIKSRFVDILIPNDRKMVDRMLSFLKESNFQK